MSSFATLVAAALLSFSGPSAPSNPQRAGEPEWATPYERGNANQTSTYEEGISYYRALAQRFPEIKMMRFGATDSGEPLHLVLYSSDRDFDIESNRQKGRSVLLINNAIHPGEPDGVDASMSFLRDLALRQGPSEDASHVLYAIIPFYNIGGTLNRNSTTRVNQNGPESHGFRGNARNYDLNRDFIKSDTKNARSFAEIFHYVDPDVLIDTHVSNGADYQHVMTMDYPQKDKLGGTLGTFMNETMMPDLYKRMQQHSFHMIPYVNHYGQTPEEGWSQFMDWPRYSSGYAALFHTIAFMSETHMLKPYQDRVRSTYAFIWSVSSFLRKQGAALQKVRNETKRRVKTQRRFELSWKVDRERPTSLEFKGYASNIEQSQVSGDKRVRYDRSRPYTKNVPYYDNFVADISVSKPTGYVFSQAYENVAELMRLNGVEVHRLPRDMSIPVEVYRIDEYQTSKYPHEGHYVHHGVETSSSAEVLKFRAGDFFIRANQEANRYIIETLEPRAKDSFFNWNFFDSFLQQKEGFSSYVFEDLAYERLKSDPALKRKLEKAKRQDPKLAADGEAQLEFIYREAGYQESEYRRYPVFRVGKMPVGLVSALQNR